MKTHTRVFMVTVISVVEVLQDYLLCLSKSTVTSPCPVQ